MRIAICFTTRNRPTVLEATLHRFKNAPVFGEEFHLFIVDDASDVSVNNADYRFPEQAGIPRAKNKCLQLAYDWGADHIFLFDDDTYSIDPYWWKPYVESKEPHLMYQFNIPGDPSKNMTEVYRDEKIVAFTRTRGAMLYVERRVLDIVGGMDIGYGLGMFEHPDWTNRIHNAGLTTHRAMDVPGSDKLLYCHDQDSAIDSSITKQIRKRNRILNLDRYRKSRASKEYKEFRS